MVNYCYESNACLSYRIPSSKSVFVLFHTCILRLDLFCWVKEPGRKACVFIHWHVSVFYLKFKLPAKKAADESLPILFRSSNIILVALCSNRRTIGGSCTPIAFWNISVSCITDTSLNPRCRWGFITRIPTSRRLKCSGKSTILSICNHQINFYGHWGLWCHCSFTHLISIIQWWYELGLVGFGASWAGNGAFPSPWTLAFSSEVTTSRCRGTNIIGEAPFPLTKPFRF